MRRQPLIPASLTGHADYVRKVWPGSPVSRCSIICSPPCFSPKAKSKPARTHVEASLAKRPDDAAAHLLAARIARAGKDYNGALSHLDRTIAIAPQREAFFEKARTLDQAGLRPQAREAWRAILEVIPQSQEAAARSGRLAWEDGDYAAAAALLERATGNDAPASVWFDLGLVRQDLRDHAWGRHRLRPGIRDKTGLCRGRAQSRCRPAGKRRPGRRHARLSQAYRLRPQMFGTIAMALTSASHGRLWIDEASLRRSLTG